MPRFFFDLLVGGSSNVDEEGTELENAQAARIEAACVLFDLAHDEPETMCGCGFAISVRNDCHQPILILELKTNFDPKSGTAGTQ